MQLKIEYLEITASQTKGVEVFLVQEKSDVKTHSGITPKSAKHSWYFDKMQMNKMQQQKSSFHLEIKAHFFKCLYLDFIYLLVSCRKSSKREYNAFRKLRKVIHYMQHTGFVFQFESFLQLFSFLHKSKSCDFFLRKHAFSLKTPSSFISTNLQVFRSDREILC